MPSPSDNHEPSGLRYILRALRSRNYRLFFAGQLVSMVGNWMTSVATGWLAYRLTGDARILGLVGFAGQIPTFLLAAPAGVLVDRWPLRPTLVVTQSLSLVQSGLLGFFAFRGTIAVPHLLVLSVMQGLINAVDIPSRQAFVVQMVDRREDLPNAIALNSSLVNAARLLGPSVAGVLIALVGEAWCYTLDAISYVGVIAALLAMRLGPLPPRAHHPPLLKSLHDGFKVSYGFPPTRAVLLLLAMVSFTGVPYTVLMPIFAKEILHGGPETMGWLMAASGLGALAGALYLASRRSVLGLGRVIALAATSFGVGLCLFSQSRWLWLSMLLMPVNGAAMIMQMASSNTVLQTLVEDDKRGRVMSFFAMSFMGTVPIGSLCAGWMAARFGAPRTVLIGGLACLAGGVIFLRSLPGLRKLVRPIYIQRGILPEVATGLRTADTATQHVAG